jgi:uncharacterized protein YbjT (DUF2867 family)
MERAFSARVVILLTGASGFIGSRLLRALRAAGHDVIVAGRRPPRDAPGVRFVPADFTRDFDIAAWTPRLNGVDAVVNAVGILREQGAQTFDAIHVRTPHALFAAAHACGVRRIVQVSALGADEHARSAYHRSKRAADIVLAALPVSHAIAQPSLVFGRGGASAQLFGLLASLPLVPLVGDGGQRVQPIHVDDAIEALVALVTGEASGRVSLVGPEPVTMRAFLGRLRVVLGAGRARCIGMPLALVRLAARAGERLPGSLLDAETLDMLLRGNVADPAATQALLGRAPRPVEAFIPADDAACMRRDAQLAWLLPVLRLAIALVWIWTGIVSLGLYPVAESYALLARVGAVGAVATVLLYGAALLDLALGVATLVLRRRRLLWLAQIGLILGYTALITWRLPEFWLHPYGPLLKNLPMLAALWLLYETDR